MVLILVRPHSCLQPHAMTLFFPYYFVFGIEPHLPMDRITKGTEAAAMSNHGWVKSLQKT